MEETAGPLNEGCLALRHHLHGVAHSSGLASNLFNQNIHNGTRSDVATGKGFLSESNLYFP